MSIFSPFQKWNTILEESTGWSLKQHHTLDSETGEFFHTWSLLDPYGDPYGLPWDDWELLTDFLLENQDVRERVREDFLSFLNTHH